ncbi:hypothetical protein [Luteococcus sp.]|uniref:hypothetical protein n=1 Tax=Luteococcus sp. TaxID=1969402 RepID=UPI00373518ED
MRRPVFDEDLAWLCDVAVDGEIGGQALHTLLIEKVERARATVVPDVPGERDVREDDCDRLIWPHRDGLIWPHWRLAGVVVTV